MTRRIVLAVAALATTGAGVATVVTSAAAAAPAAYKHQICLVTSNDPNHQTTQDYCISWNGILR